MRFGVMAFLTEHSVDPGTFARWAEDRGFESLFFPEHTHIPVSRETPYPGGGDLPREYSRTFDPFVALTAAAAVTDKIRIGTGICLVTERDPIITAKEVASLDQLSHGRFLFGVGAGWNLEEIANHGTTPAQRFALMRERVEAMKAIWTEEEAAYHGRHVNFDSVWSRPKPVQRPHPPVLVGGTGQRVLERVLAFGDEWLPIHSPGLVDRIATLNRLAEEAGRDPIPVTCFRAEPAPEVIEHYAEAGVHRCIFHIDTSSAPVAETALDRLASDFELT